MTFKKRLETAAEELVKAAYLDVKEGSESAAFKETVDAIQETNKRLKTLGDSQASLKESTDAKLNTLNQNVSNLKASIDKLQDTIEEQNRIQNLAWAAQNVDLVDSFKYYDETNPSYGTDGRPLLKNILMTFHKGPTWYYYTPNKATARPHSEYAYSHKKDASENDQKEFRESISTKIHFLTGAEPRIELEKGRYAIHSS